MVSAYIDGKSAQIEAMKLDAVDRFEVVREQSQDQILINIDGLRHSPTKDYLTFAAVGLLPTAGAAALGYSAGGVPGALLGGLGGLALAGLPSTYFLNRARKAPQWKAGSRLAVGGESQPSPVTKPGPEKLRSLVEQSRRENPSARQILFLSGHGDRNEVAHMPIAEMGQAMQGSRLDATIIDACLLGQLEVLTHLAPWAGLVLVSPHKIKARGLELPKILTSENLSQPDMEQAAVKMAAQARSTTPSFAVVNTVNFQEEFLPALDALGQALSKEQDSAVRKVMARSLSTDGLLSRRIDMGSFLKELEKAEIAPSATRKAREAFAKTVPFQKNQHSFSFHLKAGRSDQSLPEGWREFLKKADRSFKPIF